MKNANNTKYGEGFAIRALARIIDIIYINALSFVVGIFGGILFTILASLDMIDLNWADRIASGFNIISLIFSVFGNFIYFVLSEWLYGATLGKLVTGLRVVSVKGKPCSLKAAIIRSLAIFLDGLFLGIVAASAMSNSSLNQRYGDKWADTVVVKSKQVPGDSKRNFVFFMLSFLISSLILFIIFFLPLLMKVIL